MKPICLAVLDTMWTGRVEQAPRLFTINKYNTSGRRLYQLTLGWQLLVTNVCPMTASNASMHGTPDPKWLAENIREAVKRFNCVGLLLVCGNIAQATYGVIEKPEGVRKVMEIPHPAARLWSRDLLESTREQIHMEYLRQSVRRKL